MNDDKGAAVAALQLYVSLIDTIRSSLSERLDSDRGAFRQMLRDLNDRLATDARELGRKDRAGELTKVQSDFLLPAVHNAKAKMRMAGHSALGQNWQDDLAVAEMEFEHFLGQLTASE